MNYLIHSPFTNLLSKPPHMGQLPRLRGVTFLTVNGLCRFRVDAGESGQYLSAMSVRAFM